MQKKQLQDSFDGVCNDCNVAKVKKLYKEELDCLRSLISTKRIATIRSMRHSKPRDVFELSLKRIHKRSK